MLCRRGLTPIGWCVLAVAAPTAALTSPSIENGVVVLQGLDKVTARIELLEGHIGETIRFGSLEVLARACYETPPTEPPESAAFLEIDDLGSDAVPESAFVGWMFASTPGISALEHPVYDVWVVDCREPVAGPAPIIDMQDPEELSAEN